MARILIPCTPLLGHLQPALVAGQALRRQGHEVDVLTGAAYETLVHDHDLRFRALPPEAIGRSAEALDKTGPAAPWVRARRDVLARFVEPLIGQADALSDAFDAGAYDVIVADTAYLGVLPLLLAPSGMARPPVVGLAATPISTISVDASPFGSGLRNADTRFARSRNRQVNWLLHHGPLKPLHLALDRALSTFGVPSGTTNYFNLLRHFDLVLQLSLPELEYPRRELPANVRCTGPLPVPAPGQWTPPEWWERLDPRVGIVHVTQGTVDNADPQRLIVPAVRALRDSGRPIVVTTGRATSPATKRALDQVRSERVHVAEFVPYDVLLPRTELMITNGGWGGVQQAARHGVPVIVAGRTEEKAEVGARVAWSGLGLNLRTGTPSPARIRSAVATVLAGPHRERAAAIAAAAHRRPDPAAVLVAGVEALLPDRSRSGRR